MIDYQLWLQGQAAGTESPTPMLEAHWETVHHNTSILYFKQAVLCLQVQPCAHFSALISPEACPED